MMGEAGEPSTVDVAWVRYVTLCPPRRGSSWSHHSRPVQRRRAQSGDCYSELPRIPILGISVYRATQAQWRCPDSRMAAFLFLSFGAGSGCNHSEAWAGCIVSLTTPTRSSLNASRSVSLRNLAEKSSRVFLASYLLR